jgi:hypothetical protein
MDQSARIKKYLSQIPKNLNWVDVACGNGCLSKILVDHADANVLAIDARDYFQFKTYARINFITKNIEDADFFDIIKTYDAILYLGHFYHTIKNEEIVKIFSESTAKYLLLESKVHNFNSATSKKETVNFYVESTSNNYQPYSDSNKELSICQPNLPWTLSILNKYGWTINDYDCVIAKSSIDGKIFQSYLIFAQR